MFNKTIFKKVLILTTLTSIFVVGCSSNQTYKKEVEGNDDYLTSPALKPLIVPNGVVVPEQSSDYNINATTASGEVGKDVNIRPPLLPIPTISDAYAIYNNGTVESDTPAKGGFWDSIATTLRNKNIAVDSNSGNVIKINNMPVIRGDEEQATNASYVIQRRNTNGREHVTVKLTELKRMGQEVSSPIEIQYYTVSLFNVLMDAIAPAPVRAPVTDADKDAE